MVEADRLRLEQALTNLVDNALRHGDGDGPRSARRVHGEAVELHVSDEGPGFPPEFLRARLRALQPRRRRARAGAAPGSGWRSSTAIARAHGGRAGRGTAPSRRRRRLDRAAGTAFSGA